MSSNLLNQNLESAVLDRSAAPEHSCELCGCSNSDLPEGEEFDFKELGGSGIYYCEDCYECVFG